MKVYISLPKRYDKEEVKLIRCPCKKRQKGIKISKIIEEVTESSQ